MSELSELCCTPWYCLLYRRQQQPIAKPHYLCNVEGVHPLLRADLELKVHELNDFVIKKLRSLLYEAKKLSRRQRQANAAKKKEGTAWLKRKLADTTCIQ